MQLDLTSLLLVSQIISIACGAMFALDSAPGRAPSGRWFAGAFLSTPAASVFYLLPNLGEGWLWAYPIGNAVATLTVALAWIGARSVNGRSLPYPIALIVPAGLAALVLLTEPLEGPWSGALPFFLSFSAFSALTCGEFWRGGIDEPRLRQGTVLAVVCGFNACWYVARAIGLVILGPDHPFFRIVLGAETTTILLLVMIVVASLSLVAIGRERALHLAQALATQDSLTGLLNRREFLRRVGALSEDTRKRPADYALLLFDLDHFKTINDTHGHLTGDEVLVAFADVARSALRNEDLLCRYGGEEFAALLPGASATEARAVAERIRHDLSRCQSAAILRVRPTTSVGIATCRAAGVPLFDLLEQADQALYQAKSGGRDRVVIHATAGTTGVGSGRTEPGPLRVVHG